MNLSYSCNLFKFSTNNVTEKTVDSHGTEKAVDSDEEKQGKRVNRKKREKWQRKLKENNVKS